MIQVGKMADPCWVTTATFLALILPNTTDLTLFVAGGGLSSEVSIFLNKHIMKIYAQEQEGIPISKDFFLCGWYIY